jgi:type I restriction enzyme, S subunit
MIAELKPYPNMKDSGVEWLGEVPEHWGVDPIARLGSLFKGSGGSKEDEVEEGVPCVRYGDLYTRHEFFIQETKADVTPERVANYTPIRFGDVLFAASGETIEDIGRSAVNLMEADACCGGDVLVFRPRANMDARFLGYAADSPASRHQKACMGRGFTVVHIYGSELKRLALPVPPLPEQIAIVRFLDYADRRMRRSIRAKQKLVQLLEEQKQAIIHRAVTRGLDPDVPLKDSGVEWLGEVPEHWEVVPLKRAFARIDYGISDSGSDEGTIPVLTMGHIRNGVVTVPDRGGVHRVESKHLLEDKDLLFNRTNSPDLVAKVGLFQAVSRPVTFASYLVRLRSNGSNMPEFLNLALNAPAFLGAARREAIPSLHQSNLNPTRYGRLLIPLPPVQEQEEIFEAIREQSSDVNDAASNARLQIDLLCELRTRLIADVVTGKLDVREAAARLPDDDPAVHEGDDLNEGDSSLEDADLDAELQEIEA